MSQYSVGWLSLISGSSKHFKLAQANLVSNLEVTNDGSGTIFPEQLAVTRWEPVLTGQVGAIATMLGQVGLSGACIGSGKTITSANLISRKLGTCDDPLSGTPNFQHSFAKALIHLTELSAARNQDATLGFQLHALSASGNAPVAVTDGVAAPTPLVNERFRLAISKIAGVQFPEIQEIRIGFGISLTPKEPGLAGQIAPEDVGVLTIAPVLDLTGIDLTRVKATLMELSGNGATHVNTTIQLAKLTENGDFDDFANSSHITATMYGMAIPDEYMSGSAGQRATNRIQLVGSYDGTNAPIVFATGDTLSATP